MNKPLSRFGLRHTAIMSAALSVRTAAAPPEKLVSVSIDQEKMEADELISQVATEGWSTSLSADDLNSVMTALPNGLILYVAQQRGVPLSASGQLVGCEVHMSTSQVYAGDVPGLVTAALVVGPNRAWAASFEVRAHQTAESVFSLSTPPLLWLESGEGYALGPLTSHLMTLGRLIFEHPLVTPEQTAQILAVLGVSA